MSSIMPFLTRSEPTWTNDDQGGANQMTLGPLELLRVSSYINSLTVLLADCHNVYGADSLPERAMSDGGCQRLRIIVAASPDRLFLMKPWTP